MCLWTKILEKLGLKTAAAKAAPAPAKGLPVATPGLFTKAPTPISAVDVVGKLEALAKKNPQDLNWKRSIVDLLKLLGLDSSQAARKELATELGCPADKMGDSAQRTNGCTRLRSGRSLRTAGTSRGNFSKQIERVKTSTRSSARFPADRIGRRWCRQQL